MILEENHHPILAACSRTNEITEEDLDIPLLEESTQSLVDDTTGDFEEIPVEDVRVHSEYEHLIHYSILLLSKLFEFQPVYQQNVSGFYTFCYTTLQKCTVLVNQSDWTNELQDCSTTMRVITNMNFNEHNIDILLLLNTIIK